MKSSLTIGVGFPQYIRCCDGGVVWDRIRGVLRVYHVTARDPADVHEVVQSVFSQVFSQIRIRGGHGPVGHLMPYHPVGGLVHYVGVNVGPAVFVARLVSIADGRSDGGRGCGRGAACEGG